LKGSSVLDSIHRCQIVAFDKTGTLTDGILGLQKVIPLSQKRRSEEEVIALAAALERHAVHPVAHAVIDSFSTQKNPYPACTDIHVIAGQGVEGRLDDHALFIGGAAHAATLLHDKTITETADQERKSGHVIAVLVIDNEEGYLLSFSDQVRKESARAIRELQAELKRVVMLTGDHQENARSIASQLNIDDAYADLTPEAKLSLVTSLSQEQGLLMVGDGINDAPALARATVGVSMGQLSSASAREASDVVLLHNNLHALPWLFSKATFTHHIIKQNLFIAVSSIFIGTLASLGGFIPLWLAVSIHEGSTLLVGINALRVLSVGTEKF
jgi:cation transport ATPase